MTAASLAGQAPSEASRTLIVRLWRGWTRQHWRAIGLAILTMLAVSASTAAYPLIVRWIVELIEAGNAAGLRWAAPVALAITVVSGTALYLQTVATQRIGLLVIRQLQTDTFAHVMRADYAAIAAEPPGQLISRFISDAEKVREVSTRAATNILRDGLTVIGVIAVMLYLDWLMTLLVLVLYPLAFQPIVTVGKRLRKRANQSQQQMGDLTAFLDEMFAGSRLVKTYGLETYARNRSRDEFSRRYTLSMAVTKARAAVEPIMEIAGGAALGGIIVFTAWRVGQGGMSVSDLIAFITALAVLVPRARAIGTLAAAVQEGLAALARVFAVLDYEPKITNQPGARPLTVERGRVAFENVTFAYPGGEDDVLSQVSFTLEPGRTTALVGPSGAGKSTILNLIPRLYDPTGGVVRIDDQDIAAADLASVRAAISLVSQDAVLFDDTIAANIAFGRDGAGQDEIRAAAEAAAALDFIDELPDGLATRVGPRGNTLSGGQRQRIALARAFLRDAPILLLDEATSALDAESEARVQAALARLSKGRTTLVIAHRLSTVREADTIHVLEAGRLIESGSDAELKDKPGGLYARLRALQFAAE